MALSQRPLTLRWRCDSVVALAAFSMLLGALCCLIKRICEKKRKKGKTKVLAYWLPSLQTMSNLDKTRDPPFLLLAHVEALYRPPDVVVILKAIFGMT